MRPVSGKDIVGPPSQAKAAASSRGSDGRRPVRTRCAAPVSTSKFALLIGYCGGSFRCASPELDPGCVPARAEP